MNSGHWLWIMSSHCHFVFFNVSHFVLFSTKEQEKTEELKPKWSLWVRPLCLTVFFICGVRDLDRCVPACPPEGKIQQAAPAVKG